MCVNDITVGKRRAEDEDAGTLVAVDLKMMDAIAIRARTVVRSDL